MTFIGALLPYQHEAVNKMVDRHQVLVAYDLGLGKTVITIAAIETLRDQQMLDYPTLVVCLSSLKYQWAKEINKFSDSSVMVIDGGPAQRERQYAQIADGDTRYVIVNYEQVVNDWDTLSALSFSCLVMDEATAIKSFRSKRSKKIKDLSKKIHIRFALTGTPIENGRPEELYSIMQAVDPALLGKRFDLFDQTFIVRDHFGGVSRYRNLPVLHERLKEAAVRKAQQDPDVAPFLPDTIERDPILVPFDRKSAIVYRQISEMLLEDLEEAQSLFGSSWSLESHYGVTAQGGDGGELAWRGRIMSKVVALRQLCDHPKLLISSAASWDPFDRASGSKFAHELLRDAPSVQERLASARPLKLQMLKQVVTDHLQDEQNKVVVFCSYVQMASLIQEQLGGVIYTGRLSAKEKESAKTTFQTDPYVRVLISTDAGGYGVDLPQANMLINYDLPWSSGLAVQRNGRIKRASSQWPSIVIQDLLVCDSIEIRQHAMIQQKSSVAAAVIDGQGINREGGLDLSVSSLASFLREHQP
jgi:SNF2 family DNA or RNA helicase